MSRFFGYIGFAKEEETAPGVWEKIIEERLYSGEVLDNRWRTQTGSSVNSDIVFNGDFSVLLDPYMIKNHPFIVYVKYRGIRWKVTGVNPSHPRLMITVGEVYNGEETVRTADHSREDNGE